MEFLQGQHKHSLTVDEKGFTVFEKSFGLGKTPHVETLGLYRPKSSSSFIVSSCLSAPNLLLSPRINSTSIWSVSANGSDNGTKPGGGPLLLFFSEKSNPIKSIFEIFSFSFFAISLSETLLVWFFPAKLCFSKSKHQKIKFQNPKASYNIRVVKQRSMMAITMVGKNLYPNSYLGYRWSIKEASNKVTTKRAQTSFSASQASGEKKFSYTWSSRTVFQKKILDHSFHESLNQAAKEGNHIHHHLN